MNRINSKKQLAEEKKRLLQRQKDLESKIRQDWTDLKYTLRPSSLAKEAVDNLIDRKMDAAERDGGLLKSTLSYGLAALAKKLADRFQGRSGAGGS